MLVATTNDLPGYRITRHLGLVRGITVRSRSVLGNLAGGIQSVFGGKLSIMSTSPSRPARRPTSTWSTTPGRWGPTP